MPTSIVRRLSLNEKDALVLRQELQRIKGECYDAGWNACMEMMETELKASGFKARSIPMSVFHARLKLKHIIG